MEDLSFSTPFNLDENELFSFFFDEQAEQLASSAGPAQQKSDVATFKDPNALAYQLTPSPSGAPEDFPMVGEQIPPLFPMLDQLKLEPEDEDDSLSSPFEDCDMDTVEEKKPKTRAKGGRKKQEKKTTTKRAPAARKNSKRPTKKQKVEKTSFLTSLKGLSSAELEHIAETQTLTPKEQSDLKKYIRMIKNRESAQLSRERRKIYQDTLERTFAVETSRHEALKQQILELEAENKVLQREFLQFKSLIENSNLGKAFTSFADNNAFKHMTKTAAAGDSQAQATFAMYMLIVLHAFGQQFANMPAGETVPALVGAPVEARA